MDQQIIKNGFLGSAVDWVCDSYSLGIHYIASHDQAQINIIDASFFLYPLPPEPVDNFSIRAGNLVAGREVLTGLKKAELLARLDDAVNGIVKANGIRLALPNSSSLEYYSDIPNRDSGFSELHLRVMGTRQPFMPHSELRISEDALRQSTPPFDGMTDLCTWLQLNDARINGQAPSINLRIGPPVDILFSETTVNDNNLFLTLTAHPKFDTSNIKLAVREFPGKGIKTRIQTADKIKWGRAVKGQRLGILKLKLVNANSILAMLNLAGRTVRRRWFDDPEKAVNTRYVATQLFDKDLKQLKIALLDSTDSVKFEKGIASLLYLLGFSSAIQVETQAPDIIVSTPGGRLAIIECTTKISDFQNKLGKLVDRRNGLFSQLEATGHNIQVDAFLACSLPKGQIAVDDRQLTQHRVTLLTRENISNAFDLLRTPTSPDEMLARAAKKLTLKTSSVENIIKGPSTNY